MTMFSDLLSQDRERAGLREARAAWLIGASVPEYREIEAGRRCPTSDQYDRIVEVFGWPEMRLGR